MMGLKIFYAYKNGDGVRVPVLATSGIASKEKTHLLWWALRMCSVAVTLAPPIIRSCSTNQSNCELGLFLK